MKYSTLKLIFNEDKYEVFFEDLPYERIPGEGTMSNSGVYHYPSELGRETALKNLKAHLIKMYKNEINYMKERIQILEKLHLEQ